VSEQQGFQGSDGELCCMVNAMDDLHREVMPALLGHLDEMNDRIREGLSRPRLSRRYLVLGGVGAAGALALASCGGSSSSGSSSPSSAAASPSASAGTETPTELASDLKIVGLAAALEVLAIDTYGYLLTQAGKGKYGTVPGAIGTFAVTAKAQHVDHLGAWNSVLTTNGKAKVATPQLTVAAAQIKALESHTTLTQVTEQALALENIAAETYLGAEQAVVNPGGYKIAATIAPVEAMHAAILNYVLGNYPVPNSFIGGSLALPPSAFTGSA
jgi:hypothetical protein